MIKPKITKSGKVEKIIKIIKNHQQYQKLPDNLQNLHDKVKNNKISKSRKNWKITPSEPSCQPEKGPLTFLNFHWKVRIWTRICLESKSHHVRMCTDVISMLVSMEPRPLPTPLPRSLQRCKKEPLNHIWIPNQFTFKCARISFECAGKCAEGLELLHIASESRLNANLLRVRSTSHSNTLGFTSECDSPKEPSHFAFKRARIVSECASLHGWNFCVLITPGD